MTTKQFLVNKLDSKLTVKGGYIEIPIGGYAPIHPSDAEDPSIIWALTRDWASITDKEPEGKVQAAVEVEVEVTKPYEGMTAEELKADNDAQAAKAAEAKEEPKAEEAAPAAKSKKAK